MRPTRSSCVGVCSHGKLARNPQHAHSVHQCRAARGDVPRNDRAIPSAGNGVRVRSGGAQHEKELPAARLDPRRHR
jgi:hypothetical protein